MFLATGVAAPGVERVIDDEAVKKLFMVVPEIVGETWGNGEKSCTRRMERVGVGIGTAYDKRQLRECGIG